MSKLTTDYFSPSILARTTVLSKANYATKVILFTSYLIILSFVQLLPTSSWLLFMLEKRAHRMNQYNIGSRDQNSKQLTQTNRRTYQIKWANSEKGRALIKDLHQGLENLKDHLHLFSLCATLSVLISFFCKASPWGKHSLPWLVMKMWYS